MWTVLNNSGFSTVLWCGLSVKKRNHTSVWHGLIACVDGSRSYAIKRFDRKGKGKKIPQEDFAQLIGATRTTKYEASMEQVAEVVEEFCTFKTIELLKSFQRTIFCFLTGNEDMHLKNFSLLTEDSGKIRLTPVYDLLNTTIAVAAPEEEIALALKGKKKGVQIKDFVEYAIQDLYIPKARVEKEIAQLLAKMPSWLKMIESSFLSKKMKKAYISVLQNRSARLT